MLKTFSGRNASQNEFELRSFIDFMNGRNVRKYLEIGARHGDTFHEVMMSLPLGSSGVAIDYPGALWGTYKSKQPLQDVIRDLNREYDVIASFADSTSSDTVRWLKLNGPFDAILIDGDHRYEGVKQDWKNYRDLAPIIAFHDIVGEGQREKVSNNPVEVPRLWKELKSELKEGYELIEFVDTASLMGIGVICKL